MLEIRDEQGELNSATRPIRHRLAWTTLAGWMGFLALTGGVILFLVLVVAPSAGAAGGCGGA